jgi:rhodanese-related sulfurtransferase
MCKGALILVFKLISVQVLLIAAVLGATAASRTSAPTHLEGGQLVSVDDAYRMASAQEAEFIDVRKGINYGRGHVPGACYVGYSGRSANSTAFDASRDSFDLTMLPDDRSTALVFYSHGDTGWKSYKAAVTAIRTGYTNVYWMRDGLASWVARGYPLER